MLVVVPESVAQWYGLGMLKEVQGFIIAANNLPFP